MNKQVTIGIVEDHGLLRQGLLTLMKPYKSIKVLFDVSNGRELLEKLIKTKPDILLLDIEMPVMDGTEVMRQIKSKYPKLKVIILSAHFQKEYILQFFKLGVRAFLPKEDKIQKVVEAIYAVYEKEAYSDEIVTKILAEEVQRKNITKATKSVLTNREIQVLKPLCEGKTKDEVVKKLGITMDTINYHLLSMRKKTNIHSTATLIAYALAKKLV